MQELTIFVFFLYFSISLCGFNPNIPDSSTATNYKEIMEDLDRFRAEHKKFLERFNMNRPESGIPTGIPKMTAAGAGSNDFPFKHLPVDNDCISDSLENCKADCKSPSICVPCLNGNINSVGYKCLKNLFPEFPSENSREAPFPDNEKNTP